MDPLSALSIAANVFAVVDFSSKIITLAVQIRNTGDSSQLTQLEQAADELQSCADLILSQWPGLPASQHPPEEDRVFIKLADASVTLSREIVNLLGKVRGAGAHNSKRTWQHTFRQTFKTVWNKDEIERFAKQIQGLRETLQLYAVVSIKTKLQRNSQKLDEVVSLLDDRTKTSIPAFLDEFSNLKAQGDQILANQQRSENAAQTRHEQLLHSLGEISLVGGRPRSRQRELEPDEIEQIERTILLSLWFPTMSDREEIIHKAYAKTYEWIYCDPEASQKPWDNFNKFLTGQLGTYWISGKAGSGKSTLMKYLIQHPNTASLLQEWAGSEEDLIITSFYFYYKGSALQKSEAGVLRSLLHQILWSRRDMIQVAFPERYNSMCMSGTGSSTFEPQAPELKRTLTKLVESYPATSFFFAVDGLDEYDAGNEEMSLLVQLFQKFGAHPNVKVLLSSRPWVVFEESFRECPRLRLHELTRPDITHFVHDKIKQHHRLQQLMTKHGDVMENLMTEIVDASSGVFLWVYLVVSSLLEGLSNHDTIKDLRARFLELPVDLEQLYHHMWNKIPRQYRSQASRLLQLVKVGTRAGSKLSLMGLSFAEEDDAEYVYSAPIQPLDEMEMVSRLDEMRVRLLTRCIGLVEVHTSQDGQIGGGDDPEFTDLYPNLMEAKQGYPHVAFLHRTAYEFVSSPDIQLELDKAATGSEGDTFCAEVSLLQSAVLRLKSFSDTNDSGHDVSDTGCVEASPSLLQSAAFRPKSLWNTNNDGHAFMLPPSLLGLARLCLFRARILDQASGSPGPGTRLLIEFDRTMSRFLEHYEDVSCPWHWSSALRHQWINRHAPTDGLLGLAITYGLTRFVRESLQTTVPQTQRKAERPLLDYALRPYLLFPKGIRIFIPRQPAMVELLLQHGETPNQPLRSSHNSATDGSTVWTQFLTSLFDENDWEVEAPVIIKMLVLHGADLKAWPTLSEKKGFRSTLEMFRGLLDQRRGHYIFNLPETESAFADLFLLIEERGLDQKRGSSGDIGQSKDWKGKLSLSRLFQRRGKK
ncbi:hypothetical protein B0T16DRAFT_421405 [Cercophora newfieldiana]|uniref:NACHT domain-containing protein n=1 Tax=Cercophora newfieldiana TaxID=92897 RepID=A0AA40CH30_9PEZI|nr:hypothetical protein B0T16DRAFT_421405 [Cercophora newfieldiana]